MYGRLFFLIRAFSWFTAAGEYVVVTHAPPPWPVRVLDPPGHRRTEDGTEHRSGKREFALLVSRTEISVGERTRRTSLRQDVNVTVFDQSR